MSEYPDRIPFDSWINSQFSVARFYGGCKINGTEYVCDYEDCKKEINEAGEEIFFSDLIRYDKLKVKDE